LERENIRSLFKRFINNECSLEEQEFVFECLKNPKNEGLMQELVDEILLSEANQKERLGEEISKEIFANLQQLIKNEEKVKENKTIPLFSPFQALKIAASLLVILIAGFVYFFIQNSHEITQVATAFGETKEFILPDGSKVFLNGNSKVQFFNDWSAGKREITLSGEAFFSVIHTIDHQKFTVKTADHLNIEVLGTEFNVLSRANATKVVLESGKVRLSEDRDSKTIVMRPGEMVEVEKNHLNKALKKAIKTELFTSWKQQKLVLENTPFSQIALMLKDTYGLEVVLPDKSLKNKRFTGVIPRKDINILLNALSISFDLKVIKTDNKVEFIAR
jgi:transmembrane sensor